MVRQERLLVLQVRNDMPPAHLSANAGTGLGMPNIERRLQLLYGGQATIQAGPSGGNSKCRSACRRNIRTSRQDMPGAGCGLL
jgi:LytS/YehU family sensor histidine kinase